MEGSPSAIYTEKYDYSNVQKVTETLSLRICCLTKTKISRLQTLVWRLCNRLARYWRQAAGKCPFLSTCSSSPFFMHLMTPKIIVRRIMQVQKSLLHVSASRGTHHFRLANLSIISYRAFHITALHRIYGPVALYCTLCFAGICRSTTTTFVNCSTRYIFRARERREVLITKTFIRSRLANTKCLTTSQKALVISFEEFLLYGLKRD